MTILYINNSISNKKYLIYESSISHINKSPLYIHVTVISINFFFPPQVQNDSYQFVALYYYLATFHITLQ